MNDPQKPENWNPPDLEVARQQLNGFAKLIVSGDFDCEIHFGDYQRRKPIADYIDALVTQTRVCESAWNTVCEFWDKLAEQKAYIQRLERQVDQLETRIVDELTP